MTVGSALTVAVVDAALDAATAAERPATSDEVEGMVSVELIMT